MLVVRILVSHFRYVISGYAKRLEFVKSGVESGTLAVDYWTCTAISEFRSVADRCLCEINLQQLC